VHAPARESSGMSLPDTARTSDEGMRFLHLRLSSDRHSDLMLSELSGERFKGVIDGAPIKDQVPIAEAADRCLVLVDGNLMMTASTRARVYGRARRMLGGLTESGGLPSKTPTLVLATKADLWQPVAEADVREESERLVAFGRERGLEASWVALAARPTRDMSPEIGIPEVIAWMLEQDQTTDVQSGAPPYLAGRRFWQDRHE
jgi:hypothetical protein